MTMQHPRHLSRILSVIAVLLIVFAPAVGAAQTASGTGTVSVEIVPPDSVPGQPHTGTLSATLM